MSIAMQIKNPGLLLTDCKWLHPIVITFNTLCLVVFHSQWCGALQWTHWCSYLKQLICSCLASSFSGKATKVGSPPNFPKLISQLWEIPQPQYFITLSLDPHWTYFWKHYIYFKKDTKVGSQNFGYQIWFCTSLFIGRRTSESITFTSPPRDSPVLPHFQKVPNQ